MSQATLTINLAAIRANYRLLQTRLGGTECGAVVKADAYGLGVREVAPVLAEAGCTKFFVATIEEGLELRQLLPSVAIYVFHGVQAGEEAAFADSSLVPVLNSLEQVQCWNFHAKVRQERHLALLHIDTGMCRLGLSAKEQRKLSEEPELLQALDIAYVISHLACADEAGHSKNAEQLALFEQMPAFLRQLPRSFSNSSGVFLGAGYHFDLARPGVALYGVNPTPFVQNPMQPVVTLSARILQLRDVDFRQTVGYGASVEAEPGTRIAVVPVGYADGYLRALGNRGYCVMAGVKVPVIGRVSMDMITVDVTAVPEAELYPGAEIELIGEHCPVDDVALRAGTIGYEVLTRLGKRYNRVYVR